MPAVFWVDLNRIDFKKGSGVRRIDGEPGKFEPAKPFKWLTTK
jgi:hypothetical protein